MSGGIMVSGKILAASMALASLFVGNPVALACNHGCNPPPQCPVSVTTIYIRKYGPSVVPPATPVFETASSAPSAPFARQAWSQRALQAFATCRRIATPTQYQPLARLDTIEWSGATLSLCISHIMSVQWGGAATFGAAASAPLKQRDIVGLSQDAAVLGVPVTRVRLFYLTDSAKPANQAYPFLGSDTSRLIAGSGSWQNISKASIDSQVQPWNVDACELGRVNVTLRGALVAPPPEVGPGWGFGKAFFYSNIGFPTW